MNTEDDALQKAAERERRFHAEHRGHEATHNLMFLILILTVVLIQILILQWRKRHLSSFQKFTLGALWLFPIPLGLRAGYYRFLTVLAVFSLICGYMVQKVIQRPLHPSTPKLVYSFFSSCYKLTYGMCVFGYIVFVMTIFGMIDLFLSPEYSAELILDCFGYGLYFGVLSKDVVDVCLDRMASNAGVSP